MKQEELEKMDLQALKALAYDCIAQRDIAQHHLDIINNEIRKRIDLEKK